MPPPEDMKYGAKGKYATSIAPVAANLIHGWRRPRVISRVAGIAPPKIRKAREPCRYQIICSTEEWLMKANVRASRPIRPVLAAANTRAQPIEGV